MMIYVSGHHVGNYVIGVFEIWLPNTDIIKCLLNNTEYDE